MKPDYKDRRALSLAARPGRSKRRADRTSPRRRIVPFLVVTVSAAAQTLAQKPAPARLPNVIIACVDPAPSSRAKACQTWVRTGDTLYELGSGNTLAVERFGAGGVVISGKEGNSQVTKTFSGKIVANHVQGTETMDLGTLSPARPQYNWFARFFYPPAGDPAQGHYVFAACENKVTIINTANHATNTLNLDPQKVTGALTVSPDGSKAYISDLGDPRHPADLFVVDGHSGAIVPRFSMQNTPTPYGVSSLAISGDGSTLYGIGFDKPHLNSAIVALDASSGAAKASELLPKTYRWDSNQHDPMLVLSGSTLVLDDNTALDFALPPGAPLIFGSNGHGLAAFPDGKQICSREHLFMIGTRASVRSLACNAISPDGTKVYASGQLLHNQEGTPATNPYYGSQVGGLWGSGGLGVTSDGATIYTVDTDRSMVYTVDTATNLTTDAIPVCEKPQLLGIEPLRRR